MAAHTLLLEEQGHGACPCLAWRLWIKGLKAGRNVGFLLGELFFQQFSPKGNFFRMSWGSILGPASYWNVLHLCAWTTTPEVHGEDLEAQCDPPSTRKHPRVFSTLDLLRQGMAQHFIKIQKNGFLFSPQ